MCIHSINGDGVRKDDSLARSYLAPDAAMIARASAGSGSPTGTWHNHGP